MFAVNFRVEDQGALLLDRVNSCKRETASRDLDVVMDLEEYTDAHFVSCFEWREVVHEYLCELVYDLPWLSETMTYEYALIKSLLMSTSSICFASTDGAVLRYVGVSLHCWLQFVIATAELAF